MPNSLIGHDSKRLPLVRTTILQPLIRAFRLTGQDASVVLEPHGINDVQLHDPSVFVVHDTVYAIFNDVAARTRPDFCALVGLSTEMSSFVPFRKLLDEAITLGDFMTRFTAAVSRESNAVAPVFLVEDDYAYLSARRKFRPKVSPGQVDAFQVAIWVSLLHRVLDFRWDPAMLVIRLCDPAALPSDFHGLRPIKCDAQGFSIRLPAIWLTHHMTPELSDPMLQDDLDRSLTAPTDFLVSVKNVLRARIGEPDLSVESAADACGYRTDSLNRRLSKYDTTISAVIAGLRRDEAERLLLAGEETIGEIALRLGYAEATAFARAFRNWTGMSPSAFRRTASR